VVLVGVGDSGRDISCEAAKVARSVHLVTRRGVHVLPTDAFGKPIDATCRCPSSRPR
jgi:cation diffusion facilitator CzcD-associated flavoprotein CzcO